MKQQESIPVPRGWTGTAVWKGAGASLLLHLFVAAAVIVTLSGPPKATPRVIDLTLLPPAALDRRPVPPAFAAAEPPRDPGTAVPPESSALPSAPTAANPPDGTAQATPPDPATKRIAPAPGSSDPPGGVPVPTGQGPVKATVGSPPGTSDVRTSSAGTSGARTSGEGPPAGDFAWIRDAIQHVIAYPATARKMGWEGKVVVAFRLLSDGSVRDVRVVQGSGYAALDRGAIDAVRNASPFPRSPAEAEVITPVLYRLTTR